MAAAQQLADAHPPHTARLREDDEQFLADADRAKSFASRMKRSGGGWGGGGGGGRCCLLCMLGVPRVLCCAKRLGVYGRLWHVWCSPLTGCLLLRDAPVRACVAASLTMGMLGHRQQGGNGATYAALAAMRAGTPSPGKM